MHLNEYLIKLNKPGSCRFREAQPLNSMQTQSASAPSAITVWKNVLSVYLFNTIATKISKVIQFLCVLYKKKKNEQKSIMFLNTRTSLFLPFVSRFEYCYKKLKYFIGTGYTSEPVPNAYI